jgi:hypothetical protein
VPVFCSINEREVNYLASCSVLFFFFPETKKVITMLMKSTIGVYSELAESILPLRGIEPLPFKPLASHHTD